VFDVVFLHKLVPMFFKFNCMSFHVFLSILQGSLQKALDVPSSSNGLPASPVPLAR